MRARDHGIAPGRWPTGALNAITDVAGVAVGHVTLIEGDRTRTGATAIIPHPGNVFTDKLPAALAVLNGYGKFAGATQIAELGEIETPILLTNTLAVGRGIEALVAHTLAQPGNGRVTSINAVVGETNDSRLNDIRALRPSVAEMRHALDQARPGPVSEGAVGAGTGTVSFGLKAGIGTASRVVEGFVLGVLVQANFGGTLDILDGQATFDATTSPPPVSNASKVVGSPVGVAPLAPLPVNRFPPEDGSIVIILATDAPLDPGALNRLATRAFGGLARTGAALSNGSGDYALAFSTAEAVRRTPARRAAIAAIPVMAPSLLSPLFEAAIEATEEAILNALFAAPAMSGWDANTEEPSHFDALVPG